MEIMYDGFNGRCSDTFKEGMATLVSECGRDLHRDELLKLLIQVKNDKDANRTALNSNVRSISILEEGILSTGIKSGSDPESDYAIKISPRSMKKKKSATKKGQKKQAVKKDLNPSRSNHVLTDKTASEKPNVR
jgi:hypothetical protein